MAEGRFDIAFVQVANDVVQRCILEQQARIGGRAGLLELRGSTRWQSGGRQDACCTVGRRGGALMILQRGAALLPLFGTDAAQAFEKCRLSGCWWRHFQPAFFLEGGAHAGVDEG